MLGPNGAGKTTTLKYMWLSFLLVQTVLFAIVIAFFGLRVRLESLRHHRAH